MQINKWILGLTVAGLFTACHKKSDTEDYLVVIHTDFGDMKAILYDETPKHKANFIHLVESGRYDHTNWHRVIKDFMIQGGDVATKEGVPEDPKDEIPAEIVKGFHHTKGALAAARQGDEVNPERKSSSTQFYIVDGRTFSQTELTTDQYKLNSAISEMLKNEKYDSLRQLFLSYQQKNDLMGMNQLVLDSKNYVEQEMGIDASLKVDPEMIEIYTQQEGAPHLDNEYTVFGRVVEGLDVIDQIAALQTGPGDKPVNTSELTMELEIVPKAEITQKYGYQYPAKAEKP